MEKQLLTPQNVAESFGPDLLDEVACRKKVIEMTRGANPLCPFCGYRFEGRLSARLFDGRKILCPACERRSSPRTGTILEGSTLTNRQVMFVLAMLHWDIPVYTIAAMSGCDHSTVYNWRNRLMADA
jgi:hypothetical protein